MFYSLETMEEYFRVCGEIAKSSLCERARCGSIIVRNGIIIGKGFNSPPGNSNKRCSFNKKDYFEKVTDKTCCVHAEQRAIMDALRNNPDLVKGSDLFFTRIDEDGKILFSGEPYCTICSKMALDSGVKNFILWHKDGIKLYNTLEYNNLSYEFNH